MRTQLSLAPIFTPPDGGKAPVGLFMSGVLVRGVKTIVDQGGDVLVVLDRAQLAIDPRLQTPAPALSCAIGERVGCPHLHARVPFTGGEPGREAILPLPRGPLATDGNA